MDTSVCFLDMETVEKNSRDNIKLNSDVGHATQLPRWQESRGRDGAGIHEAAEHQKVPGAYQTRCAVFKQQDQKIQEGSP
ncbi:hypothetical protein Cadr_000028555 [Camelus dromedarius]|uniref:Uncharacterized protein n=1 Tax=Camelus dromedarius TaxID=9838 RepID=A0A5N4CHF7_CAMDR|nr:hypothetical protein Cadr_000028555 [Camelus dromedarius]